MQPQVVYRGGNVPFSVKRSHSVEGVDAPSEDATIELG
jgi:hypothetical protein